MARYSFERLSAQDYQFFAYERDNTPMHASSTLVFKAGSLALPGGGIDFDRIKQGFAKVLHLIPPCRQKIDWTPFEGFPVWVDDERFNLDYHIRHSSLPHPGSDEQLKRLSGRIMAQPLDPSRPLWELWIVEGLEAGRFAIISKTHHSMIDGSSGADLVQAILSTDPEHEPEEARPFTPRPRPSRRELLLDALRYRFSQPLRILDGIQALRRESEDLRTEAKVRWQALVSFLGASAQRAQQTPINGELGPHRIFDWLTMPLADLKALHRALDCTVNDVVLTILTGAIREFFLQRHVRPEKIRFRASAPVSVRSDEDRVELGEQVTGWVAELPIGLEDPLRQLARIRRATGELAEAEEALGVEMMAALKQLTPGILSVAMRATSGPHNTLITNVPGPQFPLYLLGAELERIYIQAPLLPNQGLATAIMSYNGSVCWGFVSDPDLLPDLSVFVERVAQSFQRLADVAGVTLSESSQQVLELLSRSARPSNGRSVGPSVGEGS
ncbi:MAG: wax ester/triacylglycerol synthase family O-acyltransferase [Deltaproteobacteria bacterium]|nr:wax ester/triacylglycerol synthase family O-acyltransferase [Deltaproteobacteria bacterium]